MVRAAREFVALPSNVEAVLTVKFGNRALSRSTAGQANIVVDTRAPFSLLHEAVNLEVNRIKLAYDSTAAALKDKATMAPPDPLDIWVKPGEGKSQVDYVQLDELGFPPQINALWASAQRQRSSAAAAFKLKLYIYATKVKLHEATIQRANENRIQAMMNAIHEVNRAVQVVPGPATTRYLATSFARLPSGCEPDFVNLPTSPVIEQLTHVDQHNERDTRNDAEADYRDHSQYQVVHFLIDGTPVPYMVNTPELRCALGLPPYPICPTSNATSRPAVQHNGVATNIPDVDHAQSDDDETCMT
ncbi:hypothetical protein ACHHYP_13049 [Achlya hypogyna]|uniref:Uncharacterized protein n=1 Tax=Achlya hypogyna TaxID=1202772 RepID=A0A1V9ZFY1_ACHHY|nr:hypothetical protein ACHHYP_13049 [Achlya hypogyna]